MAGLVHCCAESIAALPLPSAIRHSRMYIERHSHVYIEQIDPPSTCVCFKVLSLLNDPMGASILGGQGHLFSPGT